MRRVLVVAYYFPPMGLSGVQRVAKFVRYLPQFGWQPTVLTARPGGYFAFDQGLLDEVEAAGVEIVRTASWDPTRLFASGRRVALPAEGARSRMAALSQWLFVPDNKIGWLVPALAAGGRLVRERRFDAVLSSAPPYTGHLVGAALSRLAQRPLVLDFRDDWFGNPRHVYPTALHRHAHRLLERFVMQRANSVVTINRHIADALAGRHPGVAGRVGVIPQGYDADDFSAPPPGRDGSVMRVLYSGVFYHAQRPDTFLHGLARWLAHRPERRGRIEAVFVGLFPARAERLVRRLGLGDVVRREGYVEHAEAVGHLRRADVLWMTVGRQAGEEQISTGKLFEYVGSRRPVLGLVPPGAAAEALRAYGAGRIVDPDDVEGVSHALEHLFLAWEAGALPRPDEAFVARHERRALTGQLAALLDRLHVTNQSAYG